MAFTLSETLIALVIIGIIAAITVPGIVANSREHQIKTALKKAYSSLNQALERYQVDNGERYLPDTRTTRGLYNLLIKYNSSYKQSFDSGNNSGFNSAIYKNYTGSTTLSASYTDDGQLILNDGAAIMIEECNTTVCITNPIIITVDVNGPGKKPNQLGKDTFMFQLMPQGNLLPMGAPGTQFSTDGYCNPAWDYTLNGASCTNKVLNGN